MFLNFFGGGRMNELSQEAKKALESAKIDNIMNEIIDDLLRKTADAEVMKEIKRKERPTNEQRR